MFAFGLFSRYAQQMVDHPMMPILVGCSLCDVRWTALTVAEKNCFLCDGPGKAYNTALSNPYSWTPEEPPNADD